MARILVVDDEKSIRITLQAFLEDDGHDVQVAEDAITAVELLKNEDFDVVVTDIIMPKMSGVKLLKAIRDVSEHVQVIMVTGEPTIVTASDALRLGAFDYLAKPVTKEAIVKTVNNAVNTKLLIDEKLLLEEENRRYQEDLELMVEERTKALRNSEQKFKDMSELLPEMIYEMDLEGNITYINKVTLTKTGYSKEDFNNGISVSQLLVPEDTERARKDISRIMKGENIRENEYSIMRKDGSI
ncbi:MAG: response regulator, partial [Candidatus Electryonea clarkiae]|nr:response regulator [Candidatus Electryonea clarkiae]